MASEITLENKFDQLASSETDNKDVIDQSTNVQGFQIIQPSGKSNSTRKPKSAKRTKPPPVYCQNKSLKDLINLCKSNGIKEGFIVKFIDDQEKAIHTESINTFHAVKKILTENKVQFYSHTPREEKNPLLVLKNLSADYTEVEVKEALLEITPQFKESITCTRMKFKDSDKLPFAYFRVQLPPNAIAKPLTDCKKILNQTVRWDSYRKHEIFQCHNCQRTGAPNVKWGIDALNATAITVPGSARDSSTIQTKILPIA